MKITDAARLIGEQAEELRRWQSLGLIGAGDDLTEEDVERVRLVSFAVQRGVPPGEVRIAGSLTPERESRTA